MKRAVTAVAAATLLTFGAGCPGTSSSVGGDTDGGNLLADSGEVSDAGSGSDSGATDDAGEDGGMVHLCSPFFFDGGFNPDGGFVELDSIPTNFDAGALIVPAGTPPSGVPDVVGAFRMICNPSHEGYDDPIVFHGQPGCSHLHEFFGNTEVNADSTYASLRTTGDSTCNDPLNRSAYWVPAMYNGKGKIVRPDYITVYYKRYPKNSPHCTQEGKECVKMPRGLRFVFGYNPADPTAKNPAFFHCDGQPDAGASTASFPDLVSGATGCPVGSRIGAQISAPNCWNGQLDSPDHHSHLVYPYDTHLGYFKCPDDHPYIIPTYTIGAWYTVDSDLDRSGTWVQGVTKTWYFSSDGNAAGPTVKPGTTFHADWFGAWDDNVMQTWTDNCIDKLLSCAGGQLGDGTGLKVYSGFFWTAVPHTVDPPDSGM